MSLGMSSGDLMVFDVAASEGTLSATALVIL
jgi:hypothetical protein